MPTATRRSTRTLLLAAFSILTACGGGGNNGPVGNNNGGNMSASIDGAGWSTSAATATATPGGIFTITGVQPASGIGVTMTLYHIGAPGTFPLGVGSTVAGGLASVVAGTSGWSTPLSGAAGSVTITAVSPTRITGTFNCTAPLVTGTATPATRVITAGTFDVPVTGPSTLTVADNAGGKVSGTLAGTAFNASSIASVSSPAAGVLTFAGSNTSQTLSIIISEYTGVGTYTLGSSTARHVRLNTLTTPANAWGGTNATASGTLTVTSATTTRVKGSLTATLQPAPGFTGTPVTVSATFDIGI